MRIKFSGSRKGDVQIPFAWLFGILVGAFILGLAIFATTKFTYQQQTAIDAQTAKQIGVLLDPLETGFESGSVTSMILPSETRIYNGCNNDGYFGIQRIKISQQSLGRWTDTDVDSTFRNKYIFSEDYSEGKKFFIFTKPINFPFKVSDLMYITSSNDNYCFINAPTRIENELSNLNEENIFVEGIKTCPSGSVKVCFDSQQNCEIRVDTGSRSVFKDGSTSYFDDDALMYGAIFSSQEIYDCQLKRLMQRSGQLIDIYESKSNSLGCSTNIQPELLSLKSQESSVESSTDLTNSIIQTSKDLQAANEAGGCKLW